MAEKTTDRRVRRTRHALENALISLILEKGYDAVTIEEITDRADLGRTTFYLHFRDKEELLMNAIDTMIEDFLAQNETQPLTKQKILENVQTALNALRNMVTSSNKSLYTPRKTPIFIKLC